MSLRVRQLRSTCCLCVLVVVICMLRCGTPDELAPTPSPATSPAPDDSAVSAAQQDSLSAVPPVASRDFQPPPDDPEPVDCAEYCQQWFTLDGDHIPNGPCDDDNPCTVDHCDPSAAEECCSNERIPCCPGGCEPCRTCDLDSDTCVWNCPSANDLCCDGECCSGDFCCGTGCCENKKCEKCTSTGCKSRCGHCEVCDGGACVEACPGQDCCDDESCCAGECCEAGCCRTQDCKSCQGGVCASYCDPAQCQACVGGACQVTCGSNPCCDGRCCNNCQKCDEVTGECVPKCDDEQECTFDSCDGLTGNCSHADKERCTDCPGGRCDGSGACRSQCTLTQVGSDPAPVCPGDLAEVTLLLDCDPDCGDDLALEYSFDFADTTGWAGAPQSRICPSPGHPAEEFTAFIAVGPNAVYEDNPYNVTVRALWAGESCSSLTVPVEVLRFDADMDSDNSGPVSEAPSGSLEEELAELKLPGKIICLNNDDYDSDGVPNNDDNVMGGPLDRQNTAQLKIRALQQGAQAEPHLFLNVSPAGVVRVFNGATMGAEGLLGPADLPTTAELEGYPYVDRTLRVEGIEQGGGATITLRLYDGEELICTDTLPVTVPNLDLDADSDNSGGPAEPPDETDAVDLVESEPPGKWIYVNSDDSNADGVIDCENNYIDQLADRGDIGRLKIQPLYHAWPRFADPHLFIEVADVNVVRVFDDWRPSGVPVAGGRGGPARGELLDVMNVIYGKVLGFEGVSAGETVVSLVLEDAGVEFCRDEVLITVGIVDLDGDIDHDGTIGPSDESEEGKEHELPGIITLCNVDDDNEDLVHDCLGINADTVDSGSGAPDFADWAPVILRSPPNLPDGWGIRLRLHSATNIAAGVVAGEVVRVFSAIDDHAVPILGPGIEQFELEDSSPHGLDLTNLQAGPVYIGLEGIEFAGEAKLSLEVVDNDNVIRASDELQLKVSPLVLLGHDRPAEESFVADQTDVASTTYCFQDFPALTPEYVMDTVIGVALNDRDRWAQDEFQICVQQAPFKIMYVLLDSKRNGFMDRYTKTGSANGGQWGPDFGHIEISDGTISNSLDSFGNLEVTPPFNTNTEMYRLGRVYYGDDPSGPERMEPELREFFERQGLQAPAITFDSDWLYVGHVDEFMSIVLNPEATHGWTVVFASPQLAVDILRGGGTLTGVDPQLHIPKYDSYRKGTHDTDTVDGLLTRPLTAPIGGATPINTIEQYAGYLQDGILEPLRTQIVAQLDLRMSTDVFDVPVLYDRRDTEVGPRADAITPSLANGAVYGAVYIAPDQLLHEYLSGVAEEDANQNFLLDLGEDLNANGRLDTHRDPFHEWMSVHFPSSVTVEYIDDWETYHLRHGEVHCSSNERRTPPVDIMWWEVEAAP